MAYKQKRKKNRDRKIAYKQRMEADKRGEIHIPMASYFETAEKIGKKDKRGSYEVKMWGEEWAGAVPKDVSPTRKRVPRPFAEEIPKKVEKKEPIEKPFARIPEEPFKEIEMKEKEPYKEKREEIPAIDIFKVFQRFGERRAREMRKGTYGVVLKEVAERGAWYEPKTRLAKILFRQLVKQGYVKVDEFGRASITDKGKKLLKEWEIKYEVKPVPKFEEPYKKEVERIIREAEKEKFEVTPRPLTAEELVERV